VIGTVDGFNQSNAWFKRRDPRPQWELFVIPYYYPNSDIHLYIIKPVFNSDRLAIVVLFIIASYSSNYMCKGQIGPSKICPDGPIFQ
jgi:hypothetical protein